MVQYPDMNTKKFCLTVFLSIFTFFVMGQTHAQASAADKVFGEAWSSDIGWISFNNCTSPSSCSGANYGVTVDSTGKLSGWAWSSNIGWISFNETTGCPTPGCTTQPKENLATGAT